MKLMLTMGLVVMLFGCASQKEKKGQEKFKKPFLEKNLITNVTTKAKVIELLGSPEMVNSSSKGEEQWVYSKHNSNVESESAGAGMFGLGFLSTTLTGVDVSGGQSSTTFNQSETTLTIYFNKKGVLNYFALTQSRI